MFEKIAMYGIVLFVVFLVIVLRIKQSKEDNAPKTISVPETGVKIFAQTKHGKGPPVYTHEDLRVDKEDNYTARTKPTLINTSGVYFADKLDNPDFQSQIEKLKEAPGKYVIHEVFPQGRVVMGNNGIGRAKSVKVGKRIKKI